MRHLLWRARKAFETDRDVRVLVVVLAVGGDLEFVVLVELGGGALRVHGSGQLVLALLEADVLEADLPPVGA
jgi:hypothetical protein